MRIIKSVIVVFLLLFLMSCGSNYSDVINTCDHYYFQGQKYGAIMSIYGELSPAEQFKANQLKEEERQYINSLSAAERNVYRKRIQELNNR